MEPADDLVERVLRDALGGKSNAVQHVRIEDGSKSNRAWNAVYLMLGLNAALLVMYLAHDRKIAELEQYITATYMMAPQLKPPEKTP